MISNGNSFGLSNGQSMSIQDPENNEREGLALMFGFMDQIQKIGNAL